MPSEAPVILTKVSICSGVGVSIALFSYFLSLSLFFLYFFSFAWRERERERQGAREGNVGKEKNPEISSLVTLRVYPHKSKNFTSYDLRGVYIYITSVPPIPFTLRPLKFPKNTTKDMTSSLV